MEFNRQCSAIWLEAQIIQEMEDCLDEYIQKEGGAGDIAKLYSVVLQVLRYIESKQEMFTILLGNKGDLSLQEDILAALADKLLPQNFKEAGSKALLQKFIFISNGSFGMIYYWLMAEHKEPIEELAKQITSMALAVARDKTR